jgi:hypothetical protein
MIDTWDPGQKALRKRITPCPNAYCVHGLISRLAAKHSSMVACERSGGQVDGTNRVFAAALRSPRGSLTWIVVNDAPRERTAGFSVKGCRRLALHKYQVTGQQRDRPELMIDPLRSVAIIAGNAVFSDTLPPTSLTIYSTWKRKHSDTGIVEDPGP